MRQSLGAGPKPRPAAKSSKVGQTSSSLLSWRFAQKGKPLYENTVCARAAFVVGTLVGGNPAGNDPFSEILLV